MPLCCVTVAIGLRLLSKQTMLIFFPLAGLFLISSMEDRRELRWLALWICGLVSLCFLAPIVWWNIQNDWVTLEHTSGHFNGENVTVAKCATRWLEFVGVLFGVVSPVTSWLFCSASFVALVGLEKCDRRQKFLLLSSAIPLLATTTLAFTRRVEPNWPAPI